MRDSKGPKPVSSTSYDPISDATFKKGEPLPFSFLTTSFSEIENCKGKHSQS